MAAWKFVGDEIFVAQDPDEQDFLPFSCRFEVTEKIVNIITNMEDIEIRITNGYSNPLIKVPRDIISESTIIGKLTQYGVSIADDKKEQYLVKRILVETEDMAPIKLVFEKLGFVNIGDKEYYLADRLYSSEKSHLDGAICASAYMKPKGTFQQYRRFLIKEVSENPKLALAFVLGVTAPIAHILK